MNTIAKNPEDLIREAFTGIKKDEVDFDFLTDRLFKATILGRSIELRPSVGEALTVTLASKLSFEVLLPFGPSRFRMLLARIGTICNAASEKNALLGQVQAKMRAVGISKDRFKTESRDQQFQYRKCLINPEPGSPLYTLDAKLSLREKTGEDYYVKIVMKNSPGNLYLSLELVNENS